MARFPKPGVRRPFLNRFKGSSRGLATDQQTILQYQQTIYELLVLEFDTKRPQNKEILELGLELGSL